MSTSRVSEHPQLPFGAGRGQKLNALEERFTNYRYGNPVHSAAPDALQIPSEGHACRARCERVDDPMLNGGGDKHVPPEWRGR